MTRRRTGVHKHNILCLRSYLYSPFLRICKDVPIPIDQPNYFEEPVRRLELFERDGWQCGYCGETVTATTATLDHVIPQSLGGPHTAENLTTACLTCNSIKSGRTFEEAAPKILVELARRRSASH
jgi:hypothetical protein